MKPESNVPNAGGDGSVPARTASFAGGTATERRRGEARIRRCVRCAAGGEEFRWPGCEAVGTVFVPPASRSAAHFSRGRRLERRQIAGLLAELHRDEMHRSDRSPVLVRVAPIA